MTPLDLDMGHYAFYVWGAYGVTAAGLISLIAVSLLAHARKRRVLEALQDAAGQKAVDEGRGGA